MDALRIAELMSRKGSRIKLASLMLKRVRQLVKYRLTDSSARGQKVVDAAVKDVEGGRVELDNE